MPMLARLLLLVSALVCVAWFVHALGYWEDDAYIHLEFARSVATGKGFAFNGRVVYGDTSPLWVLLLVAAHSVIPGWIAAGKTLTAVMAVFALTGAYGFSRSLVQRWLTPAQSALFAATMLLIFVVSPYFGYWAFSGMEALLAGGVVCWALLAVAPQEITTGRFLAAALLGGLAPVLRPEMSFFTLLLGLLLLERLWRMRVAMGQRLALLAAGLVLIATPTLLWARYALRTFGMVVPNTNAAKRTGPGDSVVKHLLEIYTFGFPVVVLGLLLLAVWGGWYVVRGRAQQRNPAQQWNPAQREPVLPTLPAGGWLLFVWTAINCVFYVVDHTYVQTRYIFVTAPLLTIALLALAALRAPRVYRGLVAFALVFGVVFSALATWPLVTAKKQVDAIYAQLAAYLHTLPPQAGVAHYSIGEAAFLSQHTIVDTGGITRPTIIPYMADGSDDRRASWVYSQGAQYWVIDHAPLPGATLVWSQRLPSTRWTLHLGKSHDFDWLMLWKLPPQPSSGPGAPLP
jgi:hypothetical protein